MKNKSGTGTQSGVGGTLDTGTESGKGGTLGTEGGGLLSKFQQSELKRFEKKFDEYVGEEYNYDIGDITYKELKSFIKSSIEKAFALGKEEKGKEILEGLPKKCDGIIEVKEKYGSTVRASTQEEKLGFNTALDQIINLLKNK